MNFFQKFCRISGPGNVQLLKFLKMKKIHVICEQMSHRKPMAVRKI